jgi:hypothetical protein
MKNALDVTGNGNVTVTGGSIVVDSMPRIGGGEGGERSSLPDRVAPGGVPAGVSKKHGQVTVYDKNRSPV